MIKSIPCTVVRSVPIGKACQPLWRASRLSSSKQEANDVMTTTVRPRHALGPQAHTEKLDTAKTRTEPYSAPAGRDSKRQRTPLGTLDGDPAGQILDFYA